MADHLPGGGDPHGLLAVLRSVGADGWLLVKGLVLSSLAGWVGVAMRWADCIRAGTPFSLRRLLLEVPTVAGCAMAAVGAGEWWDLTQAQTMSLAVAGAYLGPKVVVDLIVARLPAVRPPR